MTSKAQRVASTLAGSPLFWVVAIAVLFSWPMVRSLRAQANLPPRSPVLGTVAEFSLRDQYGRAFGSRDLLGKVWIAQFLRTSAPAAMTDRMFDLQHHSRGLGDAVHLVSFTVAPETDTRAVLARFAKQHRASTHAWSFLTGPRADVQAALRPGFGLDLAHLGPTALSRFALVDRRLRIRGFYDMRAERTFDRLLRDAGLLVNRGE